MATSTTDDEKVRNMNGDSPADLDIKIKDPEMLRGEKPLSVDEIADPDAGLTVEERAKRVSQPFVNPNFLLTNTIRIENYYGDWI
jgi:hypothetical protein